MQEVPRRVLAAQRGARRRLSGSNVIPSMGLISDLSWRPRVADSADNGLSAIGDVHPFDAENLHRGPPKFSQSLYLASEGAQELRRYVSIDAKVLQHHVLACPACAAE
jgi:hypothetical protein